ncbi:MAG: hypothetical protein APF80_17400 [Alphaproteobacteria bacterium BRH_c36]|nr:MAG: hypothetical protein APF80_17400 [Alphaproteobacteria bacterium BRH_c36]
MKYSLAVSGFFIALMFTTKGFAAEAPIWPLDEVCAHESDRTACYEFESIAKRQVLGPWHTLPDSPRESCVAEVKSFGQPSYRLLELCLNRKLFEQWQSARQK